MRLEDFAKHYDDFVKRSINSRQMMHYPIYYWLFLDPLWNSPHRFNLYSSNCSRLSPLRVYRYRSSSSASVMPSSTRWRCWMRIACPSSRTAFELSATSCSSCHSTNFFHKEILVQLGCASPKRCWLRCRVRSSPTCVLADSLPSLPNKILASYHRIPTSFRLCMCPPFDSYILNCF